MSSTTNTRPRPPGSGSRRGDRPRSGRPDRPSKRNRPPASPARGRSGPVLPEEVLPFGPSRTSPEAFAEIFRTALRLAVVEGAPAVDVARSRASVLTFRSASGLDVDTAERTRCRVFREEASRLGLEPLACGPFTPEPVQVVEVENAERDEEPVRVPRGRALTDAHPRNSGKR